MFSIPVYGSEDEKKLDLWTMYFEEKKGILEEKGERKACCFASR
jgi:hypothetical protein